MLLDTYTTCMRTEELLLLAAVLQHITINRLLVDTHTNGALLLGIIRRRRTAGRTMSTMLIRSHQRMVVTLAPAAAAGILKTHQRMVAAATAGILKTHQRVVVVVVGILLLNVEDGTMGALLLESSSRRQATLLLVPWSVMNDTLHHSRSLLLHARKWTRSRNQQRTSGNHHQIMQVAKRPTSRTWLLGSRKRVPSMRATSLRPQTYLLKNSRRMGTLTRVGAVVRVATMAAAAAAILHRHTKQAAMAAITAGAAMAGRTWGGQRQHLPPVLMLAMEHTTADTAAAMAVLVVTRATASTRSETRASLSTTLTSMANSNYKHIYIP